MPISLTEVINDLPEMTVVDIGSAFHSDKLQTDYQALVDLDKVKIVGFDPDTSYADEFERRHNGKHKIHPYAIGDGTTGRFHHNRYSLTSSLYPTHHEVADKYQNLGAELMVTKRVEDIETHRLGDLSHLAGLEDVDAIYLDIQGGELDALRHAGAILEDAALIHTEVEFIEIYQGQPLFADVDIMLRDNGYMFHTLKYIGSRCLKPIVLKGDVNTGLNQYVWADAVYVKNIQNFDRMSDEKLLKLAFITNDVYGSVDLCYHVLHELDHRHGTSIRNDYLGAL